MFATTPNEETGTWGPSSFRKTPDNEDPRMQLHLLTPHIQQTARYYAEKLGFRAEEYLECEEPHICLYRGAAEIILLQAQAGKVVPNRQLYGYGYDAYLYTTDQDQLEAEF